MMIVNIYLHDLMTHHILDRDTVGNHTVFALDLGQRYFRDFRDRNRMYIFMDETIYRVIRNEPEAVGRKHEKCEDALIRFRDVECQGNLFDHVQNFFMARKH